MWWPTPWALFAVVGAFVAAALTWALAGEQFLAVSEPIPARVLIVEGWVGRESFQAAAEEYARRGYDYVITSGVWSDADWSPQRWSYAERARRELIRDGIPGERLIAAPAPDVSRNRTYESAVAVRQTLIAHRLGGVSVNVFTRGTHGRRTRCIYSRVLGTPVGIISWEPASCAGHPWWSSSDRIEEFFKESAAYPFELVLGSGRFLFD